MSEPKDRLVRNSSLYPYTDSYKNSVKVIDTHHNLRWLLKHFNIKARYNKMSRRREIIIPESKFIIEEQDNSALAHIEHLAAVNSFASRKIDTHLYTLAWEDAYHPIVDALDSVKWDGIERLKDFIRTIRSSDPDFDGLIIKTWMRQAVAAAYSESGFPSHGVLVLQGVQGVGKSDWAKKLDPINCGAIKTSATIDVRNKDSIIGLARFWIAEIGELDGTFNKSDIALLKGFITSDRDDVRIPWARCESRLVRRTAFIGTVNESNYLIDSTGNRRFWTIEVEKDGIDYQHDFDMLQVWAEVKHELDNGGLTYLPKELQEKMNLRNEDHEIVTPVDDFIRISYDWSLTDNLRHMTPSDVLREIGYQNPTNAQAKSCASAIRKYSKHDKVKIKGILGYRVPPVLNRFRNY